ncbi:uncharacterized protein LOC101785866 [Setaria italica]|uniref:uncharacterized protein LOC101785866 n=1 Tax=Setaria italica TaxID=4555 RepID=UPI000350BC15|nr:uncharacterized protein LOC101785866 [Setaria italica]
MAAYCNEVHRLEDKFDVLELNHLARRFNEVADELAKAASGRKPIPDGVFVSDQYKPSIRYKEPGRVGDAPPAPNSGPDPGEVGTVPLVPNSGTDPGKVGNSPSVLNLEADPSDPEVMEIDANPEEGPNPPTDWRAPYLDYLIRETLPTNKTEGRRIARHAKSFVIIDQELYKRSHTDILQRCIPIEQGKALIQDIHAGACGHHAVPRTLVRNAFQQGFYWPTVVVDATHVGLDLVGPFKKAPGGFTHLLFAADKFSKWIEARPIAHIKSEQAA